MIERAYRALKKRKYYRLLTLLLCIALTLTLAACGGSSAGETTAAPAETTAGSAKPAAPQTLLLPYSRADSLNPFQSKSLVNRQLATLLYDGLFRLDESWKPVPQLAVSFKFEDAKTLAVTLGSAPYSDGSSVTAQQVRESFLLAKKSGYYAQRLANFDAVTVRGNTLVFALHTPDPYAAACLDFAVVKNPDAKIPVGSGRYVYHAAKNGAELRANTRLTDFSPAVTTITLADASDSKTLLNSIAIGSVSVAFHELGDGKFQRISATALETALNNLVFLGFNSRKPTASTAAFRQAVQLLLDRSALVTTPFQGHARAASTPFNPDWYALNGTSGAAAPDNAAAQTLLNEAGLTAEKLGQVTLVLLVYKGNEFKLAAANAIAAQLKSAGIPITVSALSKKDYNAALKSGSYDMYLGEIKLSANMNLDPFFTEGGATATGLPANGASAAAYQKLRAGEITLADFLTAYEAELPFLALCYRNGITAHARVLSLPQKRHEADIYGDIAQWQFVR